MRLRRYAVVLALILAVGFQGFAFASRILGTDRGGDTAHAVLHAEGVAHHHDGHGGIQQDDSDASKQHVQHDCCTPFTAVLPAGAATAYAPWFAAALARFVDHRHDSPYLEGLKRPPR